MIRRREFLQKGLAAAGGIAALPAVGLISACGGITTPAAGSSAPSAGAASATAAAGALPDDLKRVYDQFVRQEMPGVSADLLVAAKKEGTVTCYLLAPAYNKTLADTFQKTFPFVNVELSQLVGGPNTTKYMSESRAGQFLADVVQFSSLPDARTANDAGFVGEYKVTTEGELNMSQGVAGRILPIYGELMGVAYNSKKISDADAKSFADWSGLLDAKWDGKKFAVVEVMAGGTPQLLNYYFYDKFGTKLWERMARSGYRIYPGANQVVDSLTQGETDIGVGIVQSISSPKFISGAPVHWVNSKDFLVSPSVQFVSAKAPHPSAARLFQEFTVAPTAQKIFGEGGSVSFRKGIKAAGSFASEPWYVAPDPDAYWKYSSTDLAAAVASLAEKWRAIIK